MTSAALQVATGKTMAAGPEEEEEEEEAHCH